MARRSWYMDQDSADELSAAVEALHYATRLPKHQALAAVLRSGLDAVATLRMPAQQVPAVEALPAAVEEEVLPRYLTLVRKEARLRGDQLDQLADLRRRLQSARADRAEVLTDNTLIRVAVDLLLSHAEELQGDTEETLALSVLRRAGQSL